MSHHVLVNCWRSACKLLLVTSAILATEKMQIFCQNQSMRKVGGHDSSVRVFTLKAQFRFIQTLTIQISKNLLILFISFLHRCLLATRVSQSICFPLTCVRHPSVTYSAQYHIMSVAFRVLSVSVRLYQSSGEFIPG